MPKHVHDKKRHQLVNLVNLAGFHWITILVMSESHQTSVEVDQKN